MGVAVFHYNFVYKYRSWPCSRRSRRGERLALARKVPETSPEKMGEEGGRKVEVVHTRKATVDRGKGQEQGSGLLRRTAAIPQEFSEGS